MSSDEPTLDASNGPLYNIPKRSSGSVREFLTETGRPALVLAQHLAEAQVAGRRVKLPTVVVTADGAEVYGKDLVARPRKRPVPLATLNRAEFARAERKGSGNYVALTTTHGDTVSLLVGSDAVAWRLIEAFETLLGASHGPRPVAGVEYGWTDGVVLASHGFEFTGGQPVVFGQDAEAVWVRSDSSDLVARLGFETILAAETGGPGEVRTGGGFIGGGFGIEGFVVGVAGATVLNKLTARSSVQTVLRIANGQGELTLFTDQATPEALDHWLAPVRHAIAVGRQAGGSPAAAPSVADELTKLAGLKDAGVLSAEEFGAAKTRLLGG